MIPLVIGHCATVHGFVYYLRRTFCDDVVDKISGVCRNVVPRTYREKGKRNPSITTVFVIVTTKRYYYLRIIENPKQYGRPSVSCVRVYNIPAVNACRRVYRSPAAVYDKTLTIVSALFVNTHVTV